MLEKIVRFRDDKSPETEEISLSQEDLIKLEALGYIE